MYTHQAFALCRRALQTVLAVAGITGMSIVGAQAQLESDPRPPIRPVEDKALPVKVTVTTDKKKYASGDPIKMTLTVKNDSKQAVPLRFGSGQRYDFVLREAGKPDAKPLWQWSRGMMFTMMVSSQPLEAGKSVVYTVTYASKSAPNASVVEPLKSGTYALTGTLATLGTTNRPSATTQFVVK